MKLSLKDSFRLVEFDAMASPCEIFFEEKKQGKAEKIALNLFEEVKRLENKFSRYLPSSVTTQINESNGKKVSIDEETYQILNYAKTCYELSNGKFDITTGVLRQVWKDNMVPSAEELAGFTDIIGFDKIQLSKTSVQLKKRLEIDFGGIVKEYSVDKVALLLRSLTKGPMLVNFGGDLCSDGVGNHVWKIGVESTKQLNQAITTIDFIKGGLATSGNTRRFFEIEGKRYGHIINPKTMSPVMDAPLSVSVLAGSCTEAGFLATLAMLNGHNAEKLLKKEGYLHWIQR